MSNYSRIHFLLTQADEATVDTLQVSPVYGNESEPTDLYEEPEWLSEGFLSQAEYNHFNNFNSKGQ